jgi:hypothetical protein
VGICCRYSSPRIAYTIVILPLQGVSV